MNLQLRSYQKEDFLSLQKIVKDTWHYEDFTSKNTAMKLAAAFLSSCLTCYTYSRVAVIDERVIGIILVKDIAHHQCPLNYRLKQIKSIISLMLSKEGRQASRIFKDVEEIDQQLLKECHKEYPAELSLFVVDSSCRGMGIGKKLFQSAIQYMQKQTLDEFYLFTDTSCQYGFYEHQGMIRQSEKKKTFSMGGQVVEMSFFIYDYNKKRDCDEVTF